MNKDKQLDNSFKEIHLEELELKKGNATDRGPTFSNTNISIREKIEPPHMINRMDLIFA